MQPILAIGLVVGAAILGGILYRWRGGAFFSAPRWLRLGVWTVVWFAPAFFLDFPWWAVLLAGAASTYGLSIGHGSYQDFGYKSQPTHEQMCAIVHILTSRRNDYVHDSIGMALTGVVMTLPIGVLGIAFGHWWFILAGLSGLYKTLAYFIGWEYFHRTGRRADQAIWQPTGTGEVLTGAFIYMHTAVAYVLTMG